jgi:biofilm PGA synthesis N-glycosyltransferase PgaC
MISVSVGVCAYNEEKNIEKALRAVLEQPLDGFSLKEVIVVSSASTDRTDAIVSEISRSDPRVTLVVQEKREGKTSAVNLFKIGRASCRERV